LPILLYNIIHCTIKVLDIQATLTFILLTVTKFIDNPKTQIQRYFHTTGAGILRAVIYKNLAGGISL